MKQTRRRVAPFLLLLLCLAFGPAAGAADADKRGEITGSINRVNADYHNAGASGFLVVDSDDHTERLVLVVDGETDLRSADGEASRFEAFKAGSRIRARYEMGYDALHAKEIMILKTSDTKIAPKMSSSDADPPE